VLVFQTLPALVEQEQVALFQIRLSLMQVAAAAAVTLQLGLVLLAGQVAAVLEAHLGPMLAHRGLLTLAVVVAAQLLILEL
tara:strand:- start:139 stop:381 length:243 start_codon:yes stop_codon:yes gene_type:complete